MRLDVVAREKVAHKDAAVLQVAYEFVRHRHVVRDERTNRDVRQLRSASELRNSEHVVGSLVPEEPPKLVRMTAQNPIVSDGKPVK